MRCEEINYCDRTYLGKYIPTVWATYYLSRKKKFIKHVNLTLSKDRNI